MCVPFDKRGQETPPYKKVNLYNFNNSESAKYSNTVKATNSKLEFQKTYYAQLCVTRSWR